MPGHCRLKTPDFYKTECLDCELIIGVRWEKHYIGKLSIRQRVKELKVCPFCDRTHLKTVKINETEFVEISQQWDFLKCSEEIKEQNNQYNQWF